MNGGFEEYRGAEGGGCDCGVENKNMTLSGGFGVGGGVARFTDNSSC